MKTVDLLAKVFSTPEQWKKTYGSPLAYSYGNVLFGVSVCASAATLFTAVASNNLPHTESRIMAEAIGTFMALNYVFDRVKNTTYSVVMPKIRAKVGTWLREPATLESEL